MDNLHWQLSVLAKSIHYKNLSAAASHVGLSQPQLSRIISRLEQELGIVLLDRTARRKSGWTPVAYKVAETYFRSSRKLTQSLQQLTTDEHISQLSVGLLEGLIPLASEFCKQVFDGPKVPLIELNVYDLSELEEKFEKDELDVIFTCREPGRHKRKNLRTVGFQTIPMAGDGGNLKIFSQFEYATYVHRQGSQKPGRAGAKESRVLLSNSLAIRKLWIEQFGGTGYVPSVVKQKTSGEGDSPVLMIASDLMNPTLWQKFEQFQL